MATVEAIVAEGINLAKYDPIPVLSRCPFTQGGGWLVAGDGHSRFEAIRRLAAADRLPSEWRRYTGWQIPCKLVTAEQAQTLKWSANLSRDQLTACEEAGVYAEMLATGLSIDEVATIVHRRPSDVRKMLPLNGLADCIRRMVGLSQDAGGLDKETACAMAERFEYYKIDKGQQQELWTKALAHAELTPAFVRAFVNAVGAEVSKAGGGEGMLFELPTAVTHVMGLLKGRAENLRRLERALSGLLAVRRDAPGLIEDLMPELSDVLVKHGSGYLAAVKEQSASEGSLVGRLCFAGRAPAAA